MRGRHVTREDFPLDYVEPNLVEKEGERREKEKEREEKREQEKKNEKLQLLSRISGDRVVGFRRSKR